MKALTVKEPWATAIFHYGKDIENRTWNTFHRGRILIHVSRTKPTKEDEKAFFDICEKVGIKNAVFNLSNCGLIIGSVELTKTVQPSAFFYNNDTSLWAVPKQFHWRLANPILLEKPVMARGLLGLWSVPQSICNELGVDYGD